MSPQLFIDLDGVLADFDGGYEQLFGVRPNQDTYEPPELWDKIRAKGDFFRRLPPMPDAFEFWGWCKKFHPDPIILTGMPYSIPLVREQKTLWVMEHLGKYTKIICCRSKDKCKHGKPGDVLVDDRTKYSHYWINMGGIFIQHTSLLESVSQLRRVFLPTLTVPLG